MTYWFLTVCLIFWLSLPSGTIAQEQDDRLVKKGMEYYNSEAYEQAVIRFKDALDANPGNKEPYVYLIASYLQLQETNKAITWSDSALMVFPGDMRLLWMSGESYLAAEDYKAALQRFREIKTQNMFEGEELPEQVTVQDLDRNLGTLYKLLGAKAFQDDHLDQAVDHFAHALDYLQDDLQSYINLAYLYQQKEQWGRSIGVLESGLEKFPDNSQLIKLKAQAYYNTEDHEGLLEEYRKLYHQDPDDVEIALAYAEVLLVNKKLKEAIPVYERLMDEYPKERRVYEALIDVNEQFQNPKGKIQVLRKMAKHFPEDVKVYRSMASTHAMLEQWDKARHVYDTMVQLSLEPQWAKNQIARTYAHQDSLKVALRMYRDLMKEGNISPEIRLEAARVMERLNLWGEALKTYGQVHSIDEKAYILTREGYVLERLGRRDEAIEKYRQAIELDTDYPTAYFQLARLLVEEDKPKAFDHTQTAVIKSLNKVKSTQRSVLGLLEGEQEKMGHPIENRELVNEMERYSNLSEAIFEFMTENFPEKEVHHFLDRVANEFPGSGKLFFLVGNFYRFHDKLNESISWYQQALQQDPDLLEAHLAMGNAYRDTDQPDQAIIAFERAMTLEDQNEEVYSALINLYREKGLLATLCNKWMARYRARPDNKMLRDHLIEALHKDGQYELAKRIVNSEK